MSATSTNDLETLGQRLFYLRQQSNKTLQEVSDKTIVSRSNLGKYEKDTVQPSADAIISLCNFYKVSTDWLLKGNSSCSNMNEQKNEVIFDPDLKMMIDILTDLMHNDNPDLRGWTKIQFQNAFKEHCATYEDEKKLHA